MNYLPYPKLSVQWQPLEKGFDLVLPWLSMQVNVAEEDKGWIKEAIKHMHTQPDHEAVQRFLAELKGYPLSYIQPRPLAAFKSSLLQNNSLAAVDSSTPQHFVETFGLPLHPDLKQDVLMTWQWNWEEIFEKARIEKTDFYDPLSFISYLICYRLDWESTTWSGQDGLGQILHRLLKENENKFFQAIGWITRQSLFVTMESGSCLEIALTYFPQAKEDIQHFINDEIGHYKFMEQVFEDLGLDKESFKVGPATEWLLAAHGRMARISPLAFSAMINIFEAAYYEGEDPISRVVKQSSKPYAARGYDLHYKINQAHRHCDIPLVFARHLGPQPKAQLALTLGIFELTLRFLDAMEEKLDTFLMQS